MLNPGCDVLHRKPISLKGDAPTDKVRLVETISPYFARVEFPSGRIDTVSTRNLAPCQQTSDSPTNNGMEVEFRDNPSSETSTSQPGESAVDLTSDLDNGLPRTTPSLDTSLETIPASQEYATRSGRVIKAPLRYQS